jgi:PAS domain S-box-containing protein
MYIASIFLSEPLSSRLLASTFADLSGIFLLIVFAGLAALLYLYVRSKGRHDRSETARDIERDDLLESSDNLRRILESIEDYAIFSYRRDHTITSWNPGVERVLGYGEDEFIGQKIDIIFGSEDVAAEVPEVEIQRAIEEGVSATEGIRVRKNGRRFWGSGMVRPLLDDHGEIYGFIKVLQDLTERRQLEESLEQAKKNAEEANRAKDEFIAVLSHELRSPLTPITVALDGLDMEARTENSRMFIDMIRRNLALELRLVDDLLDVTRIARGKLVLKMETFDAHAKIRETCAMLSPEMQQKHIRYSEKLTAGKHFILADPARFQQIVWNLLRNAVKFTSDGGAITVSSHNDENELILKVHDTGVGMDADALQRIFRPFVQGMPSIARMYGGLGLGLTIARALTETFLGRIFAQSAGLGKGTTFTVELPTVVPADGVGDEVSSTTHPGQRRAARLLVLDDQADSRTALKALLEYRGYSVDTADNISAALSCITMNDYDLILSDIQLEGESGWDLPGRLPRAMKAVAISALGTPANIETSARAGFLAHITKPFRVDDLDKEIQRILAEDEKVSVPA